MNRRSHGWSFLLPFVSQGKDSKCPFPGILFINIKKFPKTDPTSLFKATIFNNSSWDVGPSKTLPCLGNDHKDSWKVLLCTWLAPQPAHQISFWCGYEKCTTIQLLQMVLRYNRHFLVKGTTITNPFSVMRHNEVRCNQTWLMMTKALQLMNWITGHLAIYFKAEAYSLGGKRT